LMIRGVSTLLRSGMLTAHYHFLEEAINTTFISLAQAGVTQAGVRSRTKKIDM